MSRLLGRRAAVAVFGVLVLVDLAFVLLHDLNNHGQGAWGHFGDERFGLARDGGYAELFGYSKQAFIVIAFAFVYWTTRQLVYAAWAYVIGIALIDDAVRLHERVKEALESSLEGTLIVGAAVAEFGDLVVWSGLAVLIVPPLVVAYRRSTGQARADSRILAVLLAMLVVLVVVVDQLIDYAVDAAFANDTASGLRTAFEEGGELIVFSAFTAFALWCAHREWTRRVGPAAAVGSAQLGFVVWPEHAGVVGISREPAPLEFAPAADGANSQALPW